LFTGCMLLEQTSLDFVLQQVVQGGINKQHQTTHVIANMSEVLLTEGGFLLLALPCSLVCSCCAWFCVGSGDPCPVLCNLSS
jgi:hypothetical protein